MNHLELLMMLRRYRFLYLLVFIAALLAGGYFMMPKVLKYEGSSTFYLANESMVNPTMFSQKGQQDILQINVVQERVYQLAYSTEMMTFLIRHFNLYKHYQIDTTKSNYYAQTVRTITENINFNKLTHDLSTIVVNDRNNEMAASMANAIVWKLDELNKKYLINKIQVNLNFYNSYLEEAASISSVQNKKLSEYMEVLGQLRHNPVGSDQLKRPLSEIEFSLYEAASKIEEMTTQLILAKSLYSNALSAQKSNNLPSLVVIKKALPDLKSKKYQLLGYATLGGVLGCTLAILLMYFYFNYRTEILIVFGYRMPDTQKLTDN